MRISDWSSDVCSSDLPLCDCRISASLRQNLIEQAAILIVQRIGSDCLDRLEHRKLAPFHGVENRVHLGQTNASIFLNYCEDDVVLVGKESVYLADADRRFLRQFSRCCRLKALRTEHSASDIEYTLALKLLHTKE